VWPALADTARFNEAAEMPKYQVETDPRPDGTVEYTGRSKVGPMALTWRDLPTEWVSNQSFRHARRFSAGPFHSLIATLQLFPEGAGTRAEYLLEVEPAGLVGRLMMWGGFFRAAGKTFTRLADEAAAYARGERHEPFVPPVHLPPGAARRIETGAADLERQGVAPELVRRFSQLLSEASEVELSRVRPLRLARLWNADERAVIELCLRAVRAGLLTLRWDILCPSCRGAPVGAFSLDQLPSGAHCPSCNISYDRDFVRNVELTFRPLPAIRSLQDGEFCLFGPMSTPHVIVQQTLSPGECREVAAGLPHGDYRLRPLNGGGDARLNWNGGGFPEAVADPSGVSFGELAPEGVIRLTNGTDHELTFVIESRNWVKDALTAHRATSMQIFRDLFATEVLRPGDEAGIGQVTLMFTDLQGSTAMYARIGDAAAYRLVREHFAFLAGAIRDHDGAVVKTIGDAVMAAFADPVKAVEAALAVQRNLAQFNRAHGIGSEEVVIKMGLHVGPCIAVTLNGRLDYFGSAVNLAARLQNESQGGDIVVSADLADDPGVRGRLNGIPQTRERARVKGFEDRVDFLRLQPMAQTVAAPA
jgi:class 3 adenylate cyclase